MDEISNAAKELAMAMILQNNSILFALSHPQKIQARGYYEDPHGQTIYEDGMGNTYRLQDPDELMNGWTI